MTQIILEIDDDAHAALMMEVLGALTFVRAVKAIPTLPASQEESDAPSDFFSLAGIWAGREVSLETIRQRAWPERAR
jgi:hypothetical protein